MPPRTSPPDNSLRISGHHFFTVLVEANKVCSHACIVFRRLKLNDRYRARNRIAGKHGPMKLKFQFARNEVHVAADFRRDRSRQQTMNHQTSLLVRRDVMHALVAGNFIEEPNIVRGERSLPGNNVTNFHCGADHDLNLEVQNNPGDREINDQTSGVNQRGNQRRGQHGRIDTKTFGHDRDQRANRG